MNNFIDEELLKDMVSNGIKFKDCMKILDVSSRTLRKFRKLYGLSIDKTKKKFNCKCHRCGTNIEYFSVNKKEKVYCSTFCSHSRIQTEVTKQKISLKIKEKVNKPEKFCINCGIDIKHKRKKTKFCSRKCGSKYNANTDKGKLNIKKMVEKSVLSQSRRSKNEILFFEKCNEYFKSVDNNLVMFNVWDADIIIHDYKLAILWNGIWHYKKIYAKQSLLQIQNRDNIKVKEIKLYGYTPYIIKDMGRFSEKKVDNEFNLLLDYIKKVATN